MKKFMDMVKVIIVPLQITLFLLVCLAATLLSGIVEALVLYEILKVPDLGIYGGCIPIIMVVIMETLKLFLIFYSQRLSQAGERRKSSQLKIVGKLLIAFSFFCTLFYTANALYDQASVADVLKKDKEAIVAEYDKKIKQVEDDNKIETEQLIASEREMVEEARKAYDNYNLKYGSDEKFEKTNNIKKELYEQYTEAQTQYRKEVDSIRKSQEEKLNGDIEELESECEIEKEGKEEDFAVQSAGDNAYIKNALMFMAALVGQKNGEYSRHVYYFFVILISFITAFVLEIAIEIGQEFLATDVVLMQKIFETDESIGKELSRVRERFCSQLIKAMVMAGVFMVIGVYGAFININMILTAFGSFFFAISLFHDDKDVNYQKGLTNIGQNLKELCSAERLQVQAMQILMTIAVFIGVTIFAMHTTADLIPASFALTVGNVSGNIVFTKTNFA